jgi:hypothetical protein
VYGNAEARVHADHVAAIGLTPAAVFLTRRGQWDRVSGGGSLAEQKPWIVEGLFFPHCNMEPPRAEFAFGLDVSETCARKRQC